MISLWKEDEASRIQDDLDLRVYSSKLLGRDKTLVLHGGGNTSVKVWEKNIFGESVEILYMKGSGFDLEKIDRSGFSPIPVDFLKRLSLLPSLSDSQMVKELLSHRTHPTAPPPSVETILHGILPYNFVDHTHADAIVTVTNSVGGERRVREIYGDRVILIEYVMPGFDLARICAERFLKESHDRTIGIVLMNHGIFSFGETARESYERMIDMVDAAEQYLEQKGAWHIDRSGAEGVEVLPAVPAITALRKEISSHCGCPVILKREKDPAFFWFSGRKDLDVLSQQGPATPEHVIRTKMLPLLGRDVDGYVDSYREYFQKFEPVMKDRKKMLDPAPRVIIDREIGVFSVGKSVRDATIVGDIYRHTIDILERAAALGGYRALGPRDYFEMEYWELEQAKLAKPGGIPPLQGEIALVTGAASGIGKACVESLLKRGAVVVGVDVNPSVETLFMRDDFLGIQCDLSLFDSFSTVLEKTVDAFGGLDVLILNAGIFPGGCRIEDLKIEEWRKVMQVNLDANLMILQESFPLLTAAPKKGRVVVVGSKNVPAPGVGAAAYSASKAALIQLMRVAALEWGEKGIRINAVNPNAVFDTGIWTDEVLAARANHGGMTVDQYKKNNVLRQEVKSFEVAEIVAELVGPLFSKTTGAQIPIDGGNDRVI